MKTFMPKKGTFPERWFVVDAEGRTLGRLSTTVAWVLSGKGKAEYAPHVACGDHVIVVNAARVKLTGKKWNDKNYYRHTGYPGGIKKETAAQLRERAPEELVKRAVYGMLPKTRLGREMMKKLRVYAGPEHPHQAQVPETLAG